MFSTEPGQPPGSSVPFPVPNGEPQPRTDSLLHALGRAVAVEALTWDAMEAMLADEGDE
jgi:hypothetical protein